MCYGRSVWTRGRQSAHRLALLPPPAPHRPPDTRQMCSVRGMTFTKQGQRTHRQTCLSAAVTTTKSTLINLAMNPVHCGDSLRARLTAAEKINSEENGFIINVKVKEQICSDVLLFRICVRSVTRCNCKPEVVHP